MKYLHHTLRILTGLLFLVIFASKFGLAPSAVNTESVFTPEGWAFIKAVQATQYMFPAVGIVSFVSGFAFLLNRHVALASVVLVPITLSFALFHIFLGFPLHSVSPLFFVRELISYVPLALNMYMLYSQREKYTALLKP